MGYAMDGNLLSEKEIARMAESGTLVQQDEDSGHGRAALAGLAKRASCVGGKLAEIPEHEVAQAFIGAFEGTVPEDRRFLNGESIGEFLDRVIPALAQLRAQPNWDTVLMVLHGGTNRAILSHAITGGERVFFGNLAQTAGCINVLDVGDAPTDWVLRMSNFSAPSPTHLGSRLTTMEVLLQQYLRYRDSAA